MRILVAEDTLSMRLLIKLQLTAAGRQPDLVENGKAAVEKLMAGPYELVILDLRLPVMDGCQATMAIRKWEQENKKPPVPILLLTASLGKDDAEKCLKAGCSGILHKPFERSELAAAIVRLTGEAAPTPVPNDEISLESDPEIADLIPRFLKHCRGDVLKMKEALARGDYRVILDHSHRIAGSGTSFGFDAISEISRRIEFAAKKSDGSGIIGPLDELSDYLQHLGAKHG